MFSVNQIQKSYNRQPVLSGVELHAERGQVVGIAGENGSGKSTLLSIMSGLLKPDAGSVTLDGADVFRQMPARRKLGLVPQESAVFDDLSVRDNIRFWSAAYGVDYEPRYFVGAELRKKARQLSGGVRKRLNIELALINSPDFLVLDEPTSGLDLVYQLEVMRIIDSLRAEGRGVILASHNADELWACDTIHILKSGVFAYSGAPAGFSEPSGFRARLYAVISGERPLSNEAAPV